MKKTIIVVPALVIASFSTWMPLGANAGSDTCKDVKITISNNTKDEIKLTKFEYFDADKNKWRTESVFGGQEKLEPNKSFSNTRNLGQVGNDSTKFKVTYRHKIGGTKFENPISETTSSFVCKNGIKRTVSLTR